MDMLCTVLDYTVKCLYSIIIIFIFCVAYGSNITNEDQALRGPKFLVHPESIVVIKESTAPVEGEIESIMLECFADGNPMPTYRMYQTSDSGTKVITADTDTRYTISGGR